MLQIDRIINSVMNSNTYIIRAENTKDVWLVDCGDTARILELLAPDEQIVGVLITHGHSDHIYGLNELITTFPNVRIYTNEYGREQLFSAKKNLSSFHEEYVDVVIFDSAIIEIVDEGDMINISDLSIGVYATPGHAPSCLCYEIGDYLFTGDAYIPGVKVFTGFPKSNKKQAEESLERILIMAGYKIVMPGHTIH